MPSLIDAARNLIEATDAYDLDPTLRAAVAALNAAVVAELMQAGTHVTIPRGGRPGHDAATREDAMRLIDQGLTYRVIAKLAGVGEATVKRWAKSAGVKRTRGPKPKST